MVPEAFVSIGTRLELLILGWGGVGLVVLGVATVILAKYDGDIAGFMAAGFGVILLIAWAILLIPFNGAYHHTYRFETTVLSVSNTLDSGSGELSYSPVATLKGIDRPVAIDDARITQLEGADVTLTCRIAWHYQAADSYSCEIYSIDAPAS